jgi:SAM-dependent methyltransferase
MPPASMELEMEEQELNRIVDEENLRNEERVALVGGGKHANGRRRTPDSSNSTSSHGSTVASTPRYRSSVSRCWKFLIPLALISILAMHWSPEIQGNAGIETKPSSAPQEQGKSQPIVREPVKNLTSASNGRDFPKRNSSTTRAEPVKQPESSMAPVAIKQPEPSMAPEPVKQAEPSMAPEVIKQPQPIAIPNSDDLFTCPEISDKAQLVIDEDKSYNVVSQQILTNLTSYLSVFRNTGYDDWGHTFEEVKAGMFHWKSKKYAEVKDGMTIYESACGIGLNLFMTLEILREVHGVRNLRVYGNEYVQESVAVAQTMATRLPGKGQYGRICHGDSTKLDYVPSNSFDVVFTGYITPLANPLQINATRQGDLDRYYIALCESKEEDVESTRLKLKAQFLQEDWYAAWVGHMIRIAKPGAPIIIEQVSYPICRAYFDWGGVSQGFWRRAGRHYPNWDIDPSSIVYEDDTIFRRRYHVFMRKNS